MFKTTTLFWTMRQGPNCFQQLDRQLCPNVISLLGPTAGTNPGKRDGEKKKTGNRCWRQICSIDQPMIYWRERHAPLPLRRGYRREIYQTGNFCRSNYPREFIRGVYDKYQISESPGKEGFGGGWIGI